MSGMKAHLQIAASHTFRLIHWPAIYKLLSSENALVKLLDFVSLVCILISAFDSYSLIALYYECCRKEIAICKVNGARPGQVFRLFFVEQITLLVIAALISFTLGYLLMKTWLEQYALQTAIHWWIYPVLFLMVGAVITSCIFWHIRRAAAANPAEILKSE